MTPEQEEKFIRDMVTIYVEANPFIANKQAAIDYVVIHEPMRKALLEAWTAGEEYGWNRGFEVGRGNAVKLANPNRRTRRIHEILNEMDKIEDGDS